ncbi:MAG TPA: CsiV family protein [Gammaproteobacteria bacterium]|nr:CsiV family protein [Gammaproteobacteria bacterium]
MRKFVQYALVLMVLLNTNIAQADPIADIYQVEVIVFAHTDAHRFRAEHWPKFVTKLNTQHAINLDTLQTNIPESLETLDALDALDEAGDKPATQIVKQTVSVIDSKNYLLTNEARMIRSSKDERLITHVAWNQPLANNVRSAPIYFTGGKDQEVAAVISIKPNRNMFVFSVDLIYKIQLEDRKDDPGVDEIKLIRDVRIKKKEVYYVDHPVVSMIVIVSPIVYGTSSYSPLPNQ